MQRLKPYAPLIAMGAVIIALLIVFGLRNKGSEPDKLGNAVAASTKPATERRCASQRTYDRIKTELFRRAVHARGSDQAAFDRLASYSVVRMERPLLRSIGRDIGTVRCSGVLSVDLPPGVAVVGGRRTLSAEIDYVLQPAADGSGDVIILEGADAIVVPLATLSGSGARSAPAPVPPEPQPPSDGIQQPLPMEPARTVPARPTPAPEARPPAAPTSSVRPSFNCRYARTRGENAVCSSSGLAGLDRQMAAQYYRAIAAADAQQRRALTTTRDRFLRYRDGCASDACVADAYRGRMREIGDITARR